MKAIRVIHPKTINELCHVMAKPTSTQLRQRRYYASHREEIRAYQKSYKDKNREEINREARAKYAALDEDQKRLRRAYFRRKAKESYWRHREEHRKRTHTKVADGTAKKWAAKRREIITDGYATRCLIQRGWNKEVIDLLHKDREWVEMVRTHILAVREMRRCQSRT